MTSFSFFPFSSGAQRVPEGCRPSLLSSEGSMGPWNPLRSAPGEGVVWVPPRLFKTSENINREGARPGASKSCITNRKVQQQQNCVMSHPKLNSVISKQCFIIPHPPFSPTAGHYMEFIGIQSIEGNSKYCTSPSCF